ncbi:MAG: long-chain fatty acid--CoA ligase [Deltaproteobacteria bacterium]|nr:long-chain fatty acid--CoA ligase [Deltaproteobacteria bacterium]
MPVIKEMAQQRLAGRISEILRGPRYPEKEFTLSGCTYNDVYQMACALKSSFSSLNFGNHPVCLCTESKAVMAASLLARLSGGPPLIFPYAQTDHVLSEMHQLTGFRFAIADTKKALPEGVESVLPDRSSRCELELVDEAVVHPDKELLSLFTGGSTGTPKFWSKTVTNLFGEALYLSEKYDITQDDRVVATVSPYHIYGLLYSVLVPLVSSAGVADDIYTFPHEIISAIGAYAATVLVGVPMHYRALGSRKIPGNSLRIAFSSTGALAETDGDAFYKKNGVGIVEIYGSTETGGIATRCRAEGENYFVPYDHLEWKIIEDRLHVLSEFISPEIEREQDGFFKTGDRVQSDGHTGFMLLGRTDDIIKVGGKRVNLEEIRNKLNTIPGVRDSFVISLPVRTGRQNVVAAVVEGKPDRTHLRQSLAHMLEPYAMPRSIKFVDKIPVTASGKYDRQAIEQLFRTKL